MSVNKPNIAVLYHYCEVDSDYRDNLIFFLSTAYLAENDFYVVISGDCSVDLPQKPNITYFYTENKNYDYGGYCYALAQINDIDKYDACIFVNSSVRGPFTVSYFDGDWTRLFTKWLDSDTHLVGATMNLMIGEWSIFDYLEDDYGYPKPHSHVQTTAYALSRQALQYLIKTGFYDDREQMSKNETITMYELRLSQEIKKQGWNIKTMCAPYNTIDYRKPHEEINHASFRGSMLLKHRFFGRTVSPMESVFMKTKTEARYAAGLVVFVASHTYTSMMTNLHPDMADWAEGRDLYDRCEAIVRDYGTALNYKSPYRIFGIIARSLGKKIRRILG